MSRTQIRLKTPKLRFKGFDNSWVLKSLSDLCEKITDGTHFSPKTYTEGDYLYLTSKNIKNGNIDLDNVVYVTQQDHEEIYKSCDVKTGDVMLTKDGTIGQVCVNTLEKPFSLLSSVAMIRPNKNNYNYFLYHLIASPKGQQEIKYSITGQALQRITLTKINNFKYYIPELSEQFKIADSLNMVDNWIQNLKSQKEELENFKRGMMQKIFSQEIRFKDDSGKDYPKWEIKAFSNIFKKSSTRNSKNSIKNVLTNSAVAGIVDQQKYFDREIANQNNLTNYYIVEKDAFIYNPRISNNAPVGPMNRNKNGMGIMSPLYMVFELKKGNIDYIEKYFESSFWHHYMYRIANYGARHDRMSFSQQDFMSMPIPLPIAEEQQKIADFLNNIESYINIKDQQIVHTETWKKGLMQEMFV